MPETQRNVRRKPQLSLETVDSHGLPHHLLLPMLRILVPQRSGKLRRVQRAWAFSRGRRVRLTDRTLSTKIIGQGQGDPLDSLYSEVGPRSVQSFDAGPQAG